MNDNPADFAGLTASAKYLNKQSDSFHSTLVNIQHKIVKLGIGLEVWNDDPKNFVPDGKQRYGNTTYGSILGLTKHDGVWCIALREAHFFNPDWNEPSLAEEPIRLLLDDEITPLLEAPRDKRIAALGMIPALVTRLKIEADRASGVMDQALKQAQALDANL